MIPSARVFLAVFYRLRKECCFSSSYHADTKASTGGPGCCPIVMGQTHAGFPAARLVASMSRMVHKMEQPSEKD